MVRDTGFRAKVAVARLIGALSRTSGKGGGTTLPGRAMLRMDSRALSRLSERLDGPITVVSATNGKTTTASLLATILATEGRTPTHNRAGSNMTWGVATSMLEAAGGEGLFEVDEAWLPSVADQLLPDVILLGNLFRDQLDRYGELETIAESWREMVERRLEHMATSDRPLTVGPSVVLNADDPLVADIGRDTSGGRREGVSYFGIADRSLAMSGTSRSHDAKHCRRCSAPYEFDLTLLGHLGHYRCPSCGSGRPLPEIEATRVELRGMDGSRLEIRTPSGEVAIELPIPGLYNAYNAVAALAAAVALGIDARRAAQALSGAEAAFGRVERLDVDGRELAILLIKNPVGATEVMRTIEEAGSSPADLWIALNDGIADGRDVSWIWDADFECLSSSIASVVCAGDRAEELALRLAYADWPGDRIVVEPSIATSLDRALESGEGRLYALPTYTALLELQALLAERGLKEGYLR